jgi:Tfp pilus assembly protein PilV
MFKFNFQKQKGGMMVEVLVAVAIITIAVLSATAVAQKSVTVSRQSTHNLQAAFLLEEVAEAVRVARDDNWTNISNLTSGTTYYPTFSGGTWTFSTTPNTVDSFTRTVVLADVNRDSTSGDIVSSGGTLDAGTKLVTVNATWSEGTNNLSKSLSFYITNLF